MAKPPVTAKEAQAIYDSARQSVVRRVKDPEARKKALAAFDSDPKVQTIRRVAGMPTVMTRQQAIKETARRTIAEQKKASGKVPLTVMGPMVSQVRDVGAGLLDAANEGLFRLPARGAAAILGIDNDLMQEYVAQQGQRAPLTSLAGSLGAGAVTGAGAAKLAATGGARLAATGVPLAEKAGNVLQSVFQLRKGENIKNAAKLAGAGTAFGAATEAGGGGDIVQGALIGGGTGLASGAAYKVGKALGGKTMDVLRMTGADGFFRRYTSTTREELQRRAADFRKKTGKEPTVYELLSLKDRQSLSAQFGRLDAGEQERGVDLARARVEAIPGEVAQVVRDTTRGQRKRNISTLASEQATSRNAPFATADEARLAVGAADNPTRLAQLRRQEAKNIMGPYDERKAVDKFGDLVPSTLQPGKKSGEVVEVPDDPEMAAVIRAAAGSARIRTDGGEGLTIREVTGMIQELKSGLTRGSVIERGVCGSLAASMRAMAAITGTEGWHTAMTCTSGPSSCRMPMM